MKNLINWSAERTIGFAAGAAMSASLFGVVLSMHPLPLLLGAAARAAALLVPATREPE